MLGDIAKTLSKSYLYTHLVKDAVKFIGENLSDIEWDRDYWLHKAGLSVYKPGRSFFGGFSLFALGCLAGGAVALALAPKPGVELRKDVKDTAMNILNRQEISGQVPASA